MKKPAETVTGVGCDKEQVKITVQKLPDRPGIAGQLFTRLADNNINVDLIIQNVKYNDYNDITFTIKKDDLLKNNMILSRITTELGTKNAEIDTTVAKVTVCGEEMVSTPGIAAKMFRILGEANINIQIITTSEDRISCLIDERDANRAIDTIKNKFSL